MLQRHTGAKRHSEFNPGIKRSPLVCWQCQMRRCSELCQPRASELWLFQHDYAGAGGTMSGALNPLRRAQNFWTTGPLKRNKIRGNQTCLCKDSAQKWSRRALCGRNVTAEWSGDMRLFCYVWLVWWLRFCSRQCETRVSRVCVSPSHNQGSGFRVRASDVLHTSLTW